MLNAPADSLLAPSHVQAVLLYPSGALIRWTDESPAETGFVIEKSPAVGVPFAAVGTVGPDVNTFTDPAATWASTDRYRVRVANRNDLVSEEAVLIKPVDTDGDGLPDIYEAAYGGNPNLYSTGGTGLPDGWLARFGLNLLTSTPDSDDDHDGLTLAQEFAMGTDPTKADTDGDGVDDFHDAFPTDERRSESIPVRYYGAIDLTENLESFPTVQTVALADNNQVAFAGWEPDGGTATVAVWKSGEITESYSMSRTNSTDRVWRGYAPAAVNASGLLVGVLAKQGPEDFQAPYMGFSFANGALSEFDLTQNPDLHGEVLGVSLSGTVFGNFLDYVFGFAGPPGSVQAFFHDSFYFDPYAVSPAGILAGSGGQGEQWGACLLDGDALELIRKVG